MFEKVFDLKLNQLLVVCLCLVFTSNFTVCIVSADNQFDVGNPLQSLPEPYCSITLKFKRIDGSGPNHAYVVCETVAPSGKRTQRGYRGGPSGMNDYDLVPEGSRKNPNEAPPCGSWNVFDGAWGPIDTYTAPYNEDFPDWEGEDSDAPSTSPLDSFSAEYCDACDCIKNMLAAMEECCIAYELLGPNSNTVIFMALRQCVGDGIDPPLDSIPKLLDINPVAWKFDKKIDACLFNYTH